MAELVTYSGAEPFLTRTKARYELALHASRDAELMSALRLSVDTFYRLAHDVVARWYPETDAPPADLIDEQARGAPGPH